MQIMAGRFKGRTILSPPERAQTRPITGMVRKSLFDTLAPWFDGAIVADIYCGTGTMGLEAISRGSSKVYFAERDAGVLKILGRNIQSFGVAGACTVWPGDIETRLAPRLAKLPAPLDLAFVDPPFARTRTEDWSDLCRNLLTALAGCLAPQGIVALRLPTDALGNKADIEALKQADAATPNHFAPLVLARLKEYGDMAVALLANPDTVNDE